ncbi:hypothetical protein [Elizabethkingia anophelis]|uniref:hypothetical protein n=1 Tax=Elizabethkingia anophelis TaxID=1117645 RepID=UPI00293680F6|nr:hypothetical protein [Elizabethkingia anophelis]
MSVKIKKNKIPEKIVLKKDYLPPSLEIIYIEMENSISSGSASFSPPEINRRFGSIDKYTVGTNDKG